MYKFYCLRERKEVHENAIEINAARNGSYQIKGLCSDCGARLSTFISSNNLAVRGGNMPNLLEGMTTEVVRGRMYFISPIYQDTDMTTFTNFPRRYSNIDTYKFDHKYKMYPEDLLSDYLEDPNSNEIAHYGREILEHMEEEIQRGIWRNVDNDSINDMRQRYMNDIASYEDQGGDQVIRNVRIPL